MNIFALAVLSVLLSVTAQFALKAGMSTAEVRDVLAQPFTWRTAFVVLTGKFVVSGFVLYGLGALVWLKVLAQWDVSKAYPLIGMGFVLVLLVGVFSGEQVTWQRAVGVVLISTGVFLVGRS